MQREKANLTKDVGFHEVGGSDVRKLLKITQTKTLINEALVELDLLTAERREGHGDCVAKHSKREYLDMNMSKGIPWGNQ